MKSLSLDMVHGVRRAGPGNDCMVDFTRGLGLEGGVWAHSVIVLTVA
jgi:hypothetical protein